MREKTGRTGGDAKNAMNITVDNALNHTQPAPPKGDDNAITMALHAAENEGWNPQTERVRRFCKWPVSLRRPGVNRSLKPR